MITFQQRKNKNLVYAEHVPAMDNIIDYWKGIGTVRVFKGHVFIQWISFHYFKELMIREKIPFQVLTQI